MTFRLFLRLSLLIFLGFGLWVGLPLAQPPADEHTRTLRAAYNNFPPLSYTDEQGRAAGTIVDLTNQLARDSGLELQWQEYPISRIYNYLTVGKLDLWLGSAGVDAIKAVTIETRAQPGHIRLYAFRRKDTPPARNLQDLINKRLIVIRGYTYLGHLDPVLEFTDVEPVVAPNHNAALRLLEVGRGDYLMNFSHPLEEALKQYPVSDLERDLITEWPYTFVISRHTEDAQGIADALDAAYDRWKAGKP